MIQVQNVSKSFGPVPAVIDVTLEIGEREIVTLRGASGCGKTTLLRLIAGLEEPEAGEIHFNGCLASTPHRSLLAPHERSLGMVFQSADLWPHLTVSQNILYGVKNGSKEDHRSLVRLLLEQLGIAGLEGRYPGEISGGQARRVALARALAPQPQYLLMDEPLVNLQPDLRANLLTFTLDWVQEHGASLLYVTHDPAEAERIPGQRYLMQDGRLQETGALP